MHFPGQRISDNFFTLIFLLFTWQIVYTFDLEKWQNVHVVVSIVAVFFFYSYEVSFVKYTINYHMYNTILSDIFLMLDTQNEQVLVDDFQFYFNTYVSIRGITRFVV